MKRGKRTCDILKDVRRKVAQENDIPLVERECTHEGDCRGTCPYCEAEVRYLERELSKRRALGKAVTVAGIAVSSIMMGACHSPKTPAPAASNEPEPAVETVSQHVPEATDGQEVPPPPGQSDPSELVEVVLGIIGEPESDTPKKCSTLTDDFPVVGDIEVIDYDPEGEWVPSIAGTPAQYLKERLTVPRSILQNPTIEKTHIVLIISQDGEVKDVVFQPKNTSPSEEEKAFYDDVTRILKAMPKWKGGYAAASYEIAVSELW